MTERSEHRARAVAELRDKRRPPSGAQARVLGALRAELGGPPSPEGGGSPPEGGGAPPSVGGAGVGYAAKVGAAVLGLTAAGLTVLHLGARAVRALDEAQQGDAPATLVASVASAPAPEPEPEEHEPEERGRGAEPPPAAPSAVEAVEPADTAKRKRGSAKTPAAEGGRIAEELALIQRARVADSPARAIDALTEHARRFPKGELRDVRDALWVLARCEQGELADARRRASALAERRPSSPLLQRMMTACPALELEL